MIATRKLGPGSHARPTPGAVVAAVLVLVQALATCVVPLLHAGLEAHHAAHQASSCTEQASFRAACPLDCHEHGHQHALHDHATCTACQSLHRPAIRTTTAAAAPGLHYLAPAQTSASCATTLRLVQATRPRGPPTGLSLS